MANWIQQATAHKGRLHRHLGIPEDQTIPREKLIEASHSDNQAIAREARLALTLKKLRKNHDKG